MSVPPSPSEMDRITAETNQVGKLISDTGSKEFTLTPSMVEAAANKKRAHLLEVTDIQNDLVATILEHDQTTSRFTGLVHMGDKLVKVSKRRDRGLTHETGLRGLLQQLAEEDVREGRADLVWELGK